MNKITRFIFKQVIKRIDKKQRFNPLQNPNRDKEYDVKTAPDRHKGMVMIDTPKEGGIKTYFPGEDRPLSGFPEKETLKDLTLIKSLLPITVDQLHKGIKEHIPEDPKYYCRPSRELYRWFNETLIARDYPEQGEMWTKMRDVLCMIIETDIAYRFRLQDAIPELKVKEFELDEDDKHWCKRTPQSYQFKFAEDRENYEKYRNDI